MATHTDADTPIPLMPFRNPDMEEKFLEDFHKSRTRLDVFAAIVFLLAGLKLCAAPVLASTAFAFSIIQGTALIITLLPGYSKRRHWATYLMRLPTAIGMYVSYAGMKGYKDITFLRAAWLTGFTYARFKTGLFTALLYPVPVRGFGIMFQTVLVAFLLQTSQDECLSIKNNLPHFHLFVVQLEHTYALWQQGGGKPSCAYLCEDVLAYAVNKGVCSLACRFWLPFTLSVYGKPWVRACIVHRYICVTLGGYILPLTGLYIWEMRDRWAFAKNHGLPVSGLKETLLRGAPPVLLETAMHLFVMLSLRVDY